jgi:hypothetical protein
MATDANAPAFDTAATISGVETPSHGCVDERQLNSNFADEGVQGVILPFTAETTLLINL